jgi:hypothetical protein
MQVNEAGYFYITDRNKCPEEYREFETYLSDAVLSSQVNEKAPDSVN